MFKSINLNIFSPFLFLMFEKTKKKTTASLIIHYFRLFVSLYIELQNTDNIYDDDDDKRLINNDDDDDDYTRGGG